MRWILMLAAAALLMPVFGCSSLNVRSGAGVSSGVSTPRAPGARSPSARVRVDERGVHTDARHGYENYRPPIIRENVGGMNVAIDPRTGHVRTHGAFEGLLVSADSDGRAGLRVREDVSRGQLSDACVEAGVSMKLDGDDVTIEPPSAKAYSNGIRAGVRGDGSFDIVWDGVAFSQALEEINTIANVRIDARASEDGFDIAAVPSVRMNLLDVSAGHAVEGLATHANLKVYAEAEDRFVLSP
jgi:hypothetical protein